MGDYGLNQTFEYSELSLDSWDAGSYGGSSNTTASEFMKYSWPQYYFTSKKENVAAIKILSAEIPFVFDVINVSNNTFTFTDGGTPYTVSIPPGTYTGPQLATELTNLLSAISGGFTVTWNSDTLKFSFNHVGGGVWGLFFQSRFSPYSVLGFLPLVEYTNTGSSTIRSVIAAQVTGPYYLYLNSSKIGSLINFNLADNNPQGSGSGPQIAKIPINVNYGSIIFYQDPDPSKYFDFFTGHQFDSFDFYLTLGNDQNQVPLDMKGSPWSLKVALLTYRAASTNLFAKPTLNGTKKIFL